MLTRLIVTLFDQVRGVKTRAVENTGRDIARQEVEEEKEVWKQQKNILLNMNQPKREMRRCIFLETAGK